MNPALKSPGEWFSCLNVGDIHEPKASRREDKNLVIPGFSLVEIVGIRKINDDHYVHEVRLPAGNADPFQSEAPDADGNVPHYVTMGKHYAFTGPGDLLLNHKGRLTYPPCLCRFVGDESDTEKIHGRYVRPENSKLSAATLDRYELLFTDGTFQQLIGDPKGYLKLPNDLSKASKFRLQFQNLGWNCAGIYKYHTGEKTRGKKDDKDTSKNLLAFVMPAAQVAPPTPMKAVLHQPYTTYRTLDYAANDYDYDGDARSQQRRAVMIDGDYPVPASVLYYDPDGNQKQLVTFEGIYPAGFEDGGSNQGPITLVLDGQTTADISLNPLTLTESYLTAILEAHPSIGTGNVKVSVWPGRWLIEFIGDLVGTTLDRFEVNMTEDDLNDNQYEKILVIDTLWADSGIDIEVIFPYPHAHYLSESQLEELSESDTNFGGDAVPGGNIVWVNSAPGTGYVVAEVEPRVFKGNGSEFYRRRL